MPKITDGISFIGAGNMANAFIRGLIVNKILKAENISIIDTNPEQYKNYIMYNINIAKDYYELCDNKKFIFIVTKPAHVKNAIALILKSGADISKSVFISCCAAVPISYITNLLGTNAAVIRLMPSTPMLVGMGAVAVSKNEYVQNDDYNEILKMLNQLSIVSEFDEKEMNSIISVNGSSPAYVYLFVKAMVESAEKQGIDYNKALPLILKTIEGSIEMIRKSNEDIDTLIKNVAAPNGTTIEALNSFEENKFLDIITKAMVACTRRANEITEELP